MSDFDWDDIPVSKSAGKPLNELAASVQSRRGFLKTGLGVGAVSFLSLGVPGFANRALAASRARSTGLPPLDAQQLKQFAGLEANTADAVTLPEGYRYTVIKRWGDKLHSDSPEFKGDASDNAAAQLKQVGFNNDGHHYFPIDSQDGQTGSSTEGLLVTNHEYTTPEYFYPQGVIPGKENWNEDWVHKSQHAHGVSVLHVKIGGQGEWEPVLDSKYNRNLSAREPMQLVGPAAGHDLLKTNADGTGTKVFGTMGNCGNGFTPWNTYLTCEENFDGYFGVASEDQQSQPLDSLMDAKQAQSIQRYKGSGTTAGDDYRWELHDKRFDLASEPNEINRFGWVVEIDPFDPTSTPKKLTALGRIKHENAALTIAPDQRVVVYMGDDQVSEYIYKFVSKNKYNAANPQANRELLHEGTLYVAVFSDNMAKDGSFMGRGKWVPLTLESAATDGKTLGDHFADLGELLVNTRRAADLVGATPMDRPEWIAVHPQSKEVYATLTGNPNRGSGKERFPGGPQHPGAYGPNPRTDNIYGQVVRWHEHNNDATSTEFDWDLFVLAGNPNVHGGSDLGKGSQNINSRNTFNMPDGVGVDPRGMVWILTDGKFSNKDQYQGQGNNSMLVADPQSGEIRRFLVGPRGCEVTGITWTPDMKYLFVNIQHPGEGPDVEEAQANPTSVSTWPDGPKAPRPRPATVAIWREDGSIVGTFS